MYVNVYNTAHRDYVRDWCLTCVFQGRVKSQFATEELFW